MPNKRIRKKHELWRKPLVEIEISLHDAQKRLDRIVQRMKRRLEVYIITLPDGQRIALSPYRWHRSVEKALQSAGIPLPYPDPDDLPKPLS